MQKTKHGRYVPPPGHVSFRLLSPYAGAVIGRNGVVQQNLIRQTGASVIRVSDPVPGCGERVIFIEGTGKLDRTINVKDERGGEVQFQVSAAQAAAVRVFECLEADNAVVCLNYDSVRICRLLVVSEGDLSKRDAGLKRIEGETGAFVRVLPLEMLPPCADLSDDLIQFTGASLAVKKALISVTHCLQKTRSAVTPPHGLTYAGSSRDVHTQKDLCPVIESRESDQSCILEVDTREVVFRLVCPAKISGGLSGWEETIIKDLEEETGASIRVSLPLAGCDELVIIVSAMENKDWQYSPAQNAAACVFIKSMEDGAGPEQASVGTSGESVTAKLLIQFNQADALDFTSNTQNSKVQILVDDETPLASADEKILQIVGELSDVHVDLFQVTWKLREKMFAVRLLEKDVCLLPHQILRRPPRVNQTDGITETMDRLALPDRVNGVPRVRPSKFSPGDPLTITTENQNDLELVTSGSSSEIGSEDGYAFITKTEVEVVIPANAFGRVYGKDGCNMARVRQITGATVIIHDPSPGTDGKAVISGTPNQTQAAMSMLWAFVNVREDHNH